MKNITHYFATLFTKKPNPGSTWVLKDGPDRFKHICKVIKIEEDRVRVERLKVYPKIMSVPIKDFNNVYEPAK